jgi:hypothetical protein
MELSNSATLNKRYANSSNKKDILECQLLRFSGLIKEKTKGRSFHVNFFIDLNIHGYEYMG